MFPGYFRPSEDELRKMMKSALIVLDSNVLLNFYRYSTETRKELLDVFSSLKERLWIPHQVAKEFAKNRVNVILEQSDILNNYKKKLSEINEHIQEELSKVTNRRQHPIISIDEIIDEFEQIISTHTDELDESRKHLISDDIDDHILASIESLLEGRIGPAFTEDEYSSAVEKGEKRFKDLVPPGFRDTKKPGDAKYGDWFIWKQMLTKASEQKGPVIFITDDGKDDWWWKLKGKTLGVAPKLVEEMQRKAQVRVYLYRTVRFMLFAKEYLDSQIEDKVIKEVRDVREAALQQRRRQQIEKLMLPTLEAQEHEKKIRQWFEVLQQQNTLLPNYELRRHIENLMRPNYELRRQIEKMMRPSDEVRRQIENLMGRPTDETLNEEIDNVEETDYPDEPDEKDSSDNAD